MSEGGGPCCKGEEDMPPCPTARASLRDPVTLWSPTRWEVLQHAPHPDPNLKPIGVSGAAPAPSLP